VNFPNVLGAEGCWNMRIRKSWLIFLAFWLGGAIIATWDKDVFMGLMFALLGVVVLK